MVIESLVSICIPTYNRPALLKSALESCFAQTYPDYEIVIGDDSTDDQTQILMAEIQSANPEKKIRYIRNTPSLGQASNVNSLFENAKGQRLVLLHDDDLLMPNALQDLSNCWVDMPSLTAAFGKQYIINMDGEIQPKDTEIMQRYFRRIEKNAGLIANPLLAGIVQMFPNDGYMVLTERARAVGYRPFKEVGEACDFDFGIRLCPESSKIWFVNEFTAAYRISDDAVTRTAITAPFIYKFLKEIKTSSKEIQDELQRSFKVFAPNAAAGYARMGQGWDALRVLLSPDYTLEKRLRVNFLFHIFMTFVALVSGMRGINVVLKVFKGHVRA